MLRAAVFSGADCVYLGVGAFHARQGADHFTGEALRAAVRFCHARGCRVNAALNTLVLPGEEPAFEVALRDAAAAGCDAVIVQDLGGAALAARVAPGLALHASTQMSVHNAAGVRRLARLGFSRVILGREMQEAEIEKAAAAAREEGIELEVFVHGALCVAVSGQCYMSAFLGGRSGNRGACAGPCRLPFRAVAGARMEDGGAKPPATDATHHLSLRDLSILDALPRLQRMGVAAAKIEGRLRGAEYCAVAVDSAKKALRGEEYDRELLADVFSRGAFTGGWFAGCHTEGDAMFGARSEADARATKAALPKARELYRREAPRVPVTLVLRPGVSGFELAASDGAQTVVCPVAGPEGGAGEAAGPPEAVSGAEAASDTVRQAAALRDALGKTGGTPFYAAAEEDIYIQAGRGPLPAPSGVKAARRAALEELLALREAAANRPLPRTEDAPGTGLRSAVVSGAGAGQVPRAAPLADISALCSAVEMGDVPGAGGYPAVTLGRRAVPDDSGGRQKDEIFFEKTDVFAEGGNHSGTGAKAAGASCTAGETPAISAHPALRARFAGVEQLPADAAELCEELVLPLFEAERVPPALRGRTRLWLPRALFGGREDAAAKAVRATKDGGFLGYEVSNIAHLVLCEGLPLAGGFGLNVTNACAATVYGALGCAQITLSPELSLPQMRRLVGDLAARDGSCAQPATDALCYGHLPLMLTRACPLRNSRSCENCPGAGALVDRRGLPFSVRCEGGCAEGARSVYNPLPLWMADRLDELPTRTATLYFTTESRAAAGETLRAFAGAATPPTAFTRGLYGRGTSPKAPARSRSPGGPPMRSAPKKRRKK